MAKPSDFDLDAEEIVAAAVDIYREQGLDAVSMRSVSARLGVSPVPLYSRVGNKEALIDAIAEHLLTDLAPPHTAGETWADYAARWADQLRARLRPAHDSRLILGTGRDAFVEASRPLIAAMRDGGFAKDAAVQACRMIMWATVGFVAMEGAATPPPARTVRRARSGGDPAGVSAAESDELFALHIRYLIAGIAGEAGAIAGAGVTTPNTPSTTIPSSSRRGTRR